MQATPEQARAQYVVSSADRPANDKEPQRPRWLVPLVVSAIVAFVAGAVLAASLVAGDREARAVADRVMEAWSTGDQATIDATYAEDVRMVIDNVTLAENREQITDHIAFVIELGNTYRRVGPISEYEGADTCCPIRSRTRCDL